MKTKIRVRMAFLLCCSFVTIITVQAKEPKKTEVKKEITSIPAIGDGAMSNFVADRVNFKKEMALKEISTLNSIAMMEEIGEENRLFPADELYGVWENQYVNPFRGARKASFPDSCAIDCSSFVFPLANVARITDVFGYRPRRRRVHNGVDLKVQIGDTIYAAFDGRVRVVNYERRGYGKYLVIRHPNGLETVYGHLSGYIVHVNDLVKAGQPIALGGNTGRSSGSHLHFETRFLGQPINPKEIVDFENGVAHDDLYVFHNVKVNGRKTNIYTSSTNQIVYHRIKKGDTLGAIARKYGTSVSRLCQLNGISTTSTLRIGQALRCSAGTQTVEVKTPSQAKTVASVQSRESNGQPQSSVAESNTDTADQLSQAVYHRIQQGDTLGALAKRYHTTVRNLCKWNGITERTTLKLGRSLRCS